ncbi:MAG: hypothetical protein WAO71_12585 [Gallionella sp.]
MLILTKQQGFCGYDKFVPRPTGRKSSFIHKQLYEFVVPTVKMFFIVTMMPHLL